MLTQLMVVGGGGGEHGADAVPTLPAARETWYAAALALERAFAAGPRWRRRQCFGKFPDWVDTPSRKCKKICNDFFWTGPSIGEKGKVVLFTFVDLF